MVLSPDAHHSISIIVIAIIASFAVTSDASFQKHALEPSTDDLLDDTTRDMYKTLVVVELTFILLLLRATGVKCVHVAKRISLEPSRITLSFRLKILSHAGGSLHIGQLTHPPVVHPFRLIPAYTLPHIIFRLQLPPPVLVHTRHRPLLIRPHFAHVPRPVSDPTRPQR
jgi:hypothetical protein